MAKMIPTRNFVIDCGDRHIEAIYGQAIDVDDLPEAGVESMVRLGQLVPESSFVAETPAAKADETANESLAVEVDKLGLSKAIVAALGKASLATVGDVLKFGAENDGLKSIEGIDEGAEKKIQEAIAKAIG